MTTAPFAVKDRKVISLHHAYRRWNAMTDQQKLEALTKAAEPAGPPGKPAAAAESPADLEKANQKLAALVSKQE